MLVTVPASIWIGLTASNMTRTKTDFWFFGGIVFCVIMFGSLVEFIYHTDIREVAKPMQTGLILAVSLIAASAFRFDWFRYDAYLPGEDEIASMAVYQAGLDSRGRYVDGRVQWLNDTKEILRQTAAENFDPIYQMAENGVEKAMQNDTDGAAIQVMYQLKNGRFFEIIRFSQRCIRLRKIGCLQIRTMWRICMPCIRCRKKHMIRWNFLHYMDILGPCI